MRPTISSLWLASACLLCMVASGCSLSSTSGPTPDAGLAIQGMVHGGQQPIVGAHVYLLAANTTGYGKASVSLLTNVPEVTTLDTSGGPTNGDYYVTTVAQGAFSITGDYSCTPNTQVYLYALGGNPGLTLGTNNSSSGLLAALGNCPSAGNFLTQTPFIFMNEVTTVAAAYAFAGFAADATHVSSSGTALAQIDITNAFANAANLANISSGASLATTPAGNGTVPQTRINTLGNILAACVNSSGAVTGPASPTSCYTLFNSAESNGSTGTIPSDTATAAINIAHNPAANLAALYPLGSSTPPFAPALTAQPNDFTIGLQFTGGGLAFDIFLAIDGVGNAWIADGVGHPYVTELSPVGAVLSGSTGYTVGGLSTPQGIAIDLSGDVWVADNASGKGLTELSSTGGAISASTSNTSGGLNSPYSVAIDGLNNVWAPNGVHPYALVELANGGSALSGTAGYSSDGFSDAAIAVDGSGNIWMPSYSTFAGAQKFSNSGTLLSGASGYSAGSGTQVATATPNCIAIDSSGNVWMTENRGSVGTSSVVKLSNAGAVLSGTNGYTGGGISDPYGIAIDGGGNVWVANENTNSVAKLSSSGSILSGTTGYTGGSLSAPAGLALDGSGDVWVVSENNENIVELIGASTPVITPIAAGLPATPTVDGSSKLGTLP
jgi:hypothetical protein